MGLGLQAGLKLPKGSFFSARPSAKSIAKQLSRLLQSSELDGYARVIPGEDGSSLLVKLHPAEEELRLWLEDDWLMASAKTSSTGPGYHGFLVGMLDRLAEALGSAWVWDDEARDFLDETGFATERDFAALQAAMARQLQATAKWVASDDLDPLGSFRLSLAIDFDPERPGEILSPLGPWTLPWFESVARADEARLLPFAQRFYPWWDDGFTPDTRQKLALVLLWIEFPWCAPLAPEERQIGEVALRFLESAGPEWHAEGREAPDSDELKRLLAARTDAVIPPQRDGVGYRRGPMSRPVPGPWRIIVPGYFREEIDDDGGAQTYWFDDFVVRGSSLSFKADPERPGKLVRDGDYEMRFERDGLIGGANLERVETKPPCTHLHGVVEAGDGVCIVTITYSAAADREKAVEIFESVRYRPPRSADA
jgi:hypothetical protein